MRPPRTMLAGLAALALVPALFATVSASTLTAAPQPRDVNAALTASTGPDAAHPYSAPAWSPLHTPARISCVISNCTKNGAATHGVWAMDFLGNLGDPIYSAGAGVFHVGEIRPGCVSTPSAIERGTWAWVDHGGGRVTRYHHLDKIVAVEGQRVTPATVIGRMGHAGDIAPCTTNYLHFEVRHGGVNGLRVNPGSLSLCTPSGKVSMPGMFGGAKSFNDLAPYVNWVPTGNASCAGTPWASTPAQPYLKAASVDRGVRLVWTRPPAAATGVAVAVETWHPSLSAYGAPAFRYLPGTATGTTVPSLTNGRTYRFKVATANASGYSAWSATKTVVPAGLPKAPRAPRFLTSPTKDYIHYGWWRADANGSTISGYRVQSRCAKPGGSYGAWRETRTSPAVYYANVRGLTGMTVCQAKVRASASTGLSPWSVTSTIRKSP